MDNDKETNWLAQQIKSAHNSFSSWPTWMKEAAKFEGSSKRSSSDLPTRVSIVTCNKSPT